MRAQRIQLSHEASGYLRWAGDQADDAALDGQAGPDSDSLSLSLCLSLSLSRSLFLFLSVSFALSRSLTVPLSLSLSLYIICINTYINIHKKQHVQICIETKTYAPGGCLWMARVFAERGFMMTNISML